MTALALVKGGRFRIVGLRFEVADLAPLVRRASEWGLGRQFRFLVVRGMAGPAGLRRRIRRGIVVVMTRCAGDPGTTFTGGRVVASMGEKQGARLGGLLGEQDDVKRPVVVGRLFQHRAAGGAQRKTRKGREEDRLEVPATCLHRTALAARPRSGN